MAAKKKKGAGRKPNYSGGALGGRLLSLGDSIDRSNEAVSGVLEMLVSGQDSLAKSQETLANAQADLYNRIKALERDDCTTPLPEHSPAVPAVVHPEPKPAEKFSFSIKGDATPDELYGFYTSAVAARDAGRYDEALVIIKAVESTGRFAKQDILYAELGALNLVLGDIAAAKQAFDRIFSMPAESIDPNVKKAAVHNAGRIFEIEGRQYNPADFPEIADGEPKIKVYLRQAAVQ